MADLADITWADDSHASTPDGFSALLQRGRQSGRILVNISNKARCIIVVAADTYEQAVQKAETEIRLLQEASRG